MIEELTPSRIVDQNGTVYADAPCSNWGMMDKINEIIRYLNARDLALTAEDVGCIIHLADQFGKDYQRIADVFNKDREEEK
jgi:hypothetical protein